MSTENMPALAVYAQAAAEVLPKVRAANPGFEEDELRLAAEEFVGELENRMLKAYYQFGCKPSEADKRELLAIFTDQGVSQETAEILYTDIAIPHFQNVDNKTPHH